MASIFTSDETKLSASMKIALGFSVFLHLGVVIAGMVGMPYIQKPLILPPQAVAVEIVDVSELTTAKKKPSFAPIKPKEKKEPPKEEKKVVAPPKVEATEPPKIKSLDKIAETKKDTVKPKPKTPPPPSENLKKPKPPEPKKKEEPKEEAVEQEDPLLSLMKNLQDSEDSAETDKPDDGSADNSPDAPIAEYVTANELNALANQLISCWQIPIGAKNVSDMVVNIRIWANADRTVKRVEIEDKWRMSNDPAFRALAESAKRAVLDPYCSPLDIPEDKYNVWKDQYIVVPFDPSRVT
jgi:hypothetical protein